MAYSNFISSPASTVVFERNVGGKFGGAMFSINQIPSTGATFGGYVSFLNNTAESGGGVVSPRSYLNLEGETLFKGQKPRRLWARQNGKVGGNSTRQYNINISLSASHQLAIRIDVTAPASKS